MEVEKLSKDTALLIDESQGVCLDTTETLPMDYGVNMTSSVWNMLHKEDAEREQAAMEASSSKGKDEKPPEEAVEVPWKICIKVWVYGELFGLVSFGSFQMFPVVT